MDMKLFSNKCYTVIYAFFCFFIFSKNIFYAQEIEKKEKQLRENENNLGKLNQINELKMLKARYEVVRKQFLQENLRNIGLLNLANERKNSINLERMILNIRQIQEYQTEKKKQSSLVLMKNFKSHEPAYQLAMYIKRELLRNRFSRLENRTKWSFLGAARDIFPETESFYPLNLKNFFDLGKDKEAQAEPSFLKALKMNLDLLLAKQRDGIYPNLILNEVHQLTNIDQYLLAKNAELKEILDIYYYAQANKIIKVYLTQEKLNLNFSEKKDEIEYMLPRLKNLIDLLKIIKGESIQKTMYFLPKIKKGWSGWFPLEEEMRVLSVDEIKNIFGGDENLSRFSSADYDLAIHILEWLGMKMDSILED